MNQRSLSSNFALSVLAGNLFFLALLSTLAVAQSAGSEEEQCRRNQETIGKALTEYYNEASPDFEWERVPRRLKQLRPKYMSKVPKCPVGGRYHYSDDRLGRGNAAGFIAYYLLRCRHHRNIGFNRMSGAVDPRKLKTPPFAEESVKHGIKRRAARRKQQ